MNESRTADLPDSMRMGDISATETAVRVYLGIDVGLSGAIAALDSSGALLWAMRTPTVAGEYDLNRMCAALRRESERREVWVALEDVGAARVEGRTQGGTSMFTFGEGKGLWKGMIAALGLPRIDVKPQAWTRELLAGMPRVEMPPKTSPADELKKARAQAAIQRKKNAATRAIALWPSIPIKFKADWPLGDAACIAEFARRIHSGETAAKASA